MLKEQGCGLGLPSIAILAFGSLIMVNPSTLTHGFYSGRCTETKRPTRRSSGRADARHSALTLAFEENGLVEHVEPSLAERESLMEANASKRHANQYPPVHQGFGLAKAEGETLRDALSDADRQRAPSICSWRLEGGRWRRWKRVGLVLPCVGQHSICLSRHSTGSGDLKSFACRHIPPGVSFSAWPTAPFGVLACPRCLWNVNCRLWSCDSVFA